jgi:serine/threonine-protein kinase ATR
MRHEYVHASPSEVLTTTHTHLATLDHLQNPNIVSHSNKLDITLPADDMSRFMSIFEGTETSPVSRNHCSYVIRDATEGLSHARNVLSMLVDISMAAVTSYDATLAFQDYVGWLLDSFLVTHELHKKWRASLSLHPSCSEACAMPFCSVHALLTALQESLSPSLLRKGYTLLSMLCAYLLEDPTQGLQSSIRLSVCSSIMNLAGICHKYDSVRRVASLHLIPVIYATLSGGNTVISNMGNDLKVSRLFSMFLELCSLHDRFLA